MESLKPCNTCKENKEATEFHRDKNRRDGRCYQCKECAKTRLVQYRKDQK